MYRRPKFQEALLEIREEMARESDHDVDFFAEMVRSGVSPATDQRHSMTNSEQPDSEFPANGTLRTKSVHSETKERFG